MKIRIITNAHRVGGGELSTGMIATMLLNRGHEVILHPTELPIARKYPFDIRAKLGRVFDQNVSDFDCEALFYYANNFCLQTEKHKKKWKAYFDGAERAYMCLNWGIGDAAATWFHSSFNKIVFLSTALRKKFESAASINAARLLVHAPAVNLEPFINLRLSYDKPIFIRHGKPNKWSRETPKIVHGLRVLYPEAEFVFMGMPAHMLGACGPVHWYEAFAMPVPDFLKRGNIFIHPLPEGFTDQGPRVICEAMAAGMPVVADRCDGAIDRIIHQETGFLAHHHQQQNEFIKGGMFCVGTGMDHVKNLGMAAREHARIEFDPQWWADLIVGKFDT